MRAVEIIAQHASDCTAPTEELQASEIRDLYQDILLSVVFIVASKSLEPKHVELHHANDVVDSNPKHDPEKVTIGHEERSGLKYALSKLSDAEFGIIAQRLGLGYDSEAKSIAQVAEDLFMTKAEVQKLEGTAYTKLRAILAPLR